ncbi:leucine-rich repeat domain-containing protein [Treponema bryantii]|uniref:leucine-rich repeat domain-containing protein n=1 Tax=Treponema bryantii TaxID=163 RepID=UPI0003B2EFDF|nr:leucine-rich repeat domain-containing protein [Treponema bryantii]
MKKLIKIVVPALFLLISCQPEVIEKEVEVEKKSEGEGSASPKYGLISIKTSLPNDNGADIKLTNDSAPVNVKITGPDSIEKVMWKKGSKGIGVKPVSFFADSNSHQLLLDSNSSGTFTVTENGWYDIVAQDIAGRYEWEQVEVKTIDKTPLNEISNFSAICENGCIILSWTNPLDEGQYDSPLNKLKFKYIYDNNEMDSDNGIITVGSGEQLVSIPIAAGKNENSIMYVLAKTIDGVGNESNGTSIQTLCSETIYTTLESIAEKLNNMTYNGKVVVSGAYNETLLKNIKNSLHSRNIKLILDLSGISEMDVVPSNCFENCECLMEVILPDSIIRIGDSAFSGCTSLNKINIPQGVTDIGGSSFYGCKSLTSVNLPDTITSIAIAAFSHCSNIKQINIPLRLTIINQRVFEYCFAPNVELTIPRSVKTVDIKAFISNIGLKLVFEDTESIWYRDDSYTQERNIYVGPMNGENAMLPMNSLYGLSVYYIVNDE